MQPGLSINPQKLEAFKGKAVAVRVVEDGEAAIVNAL